MQKQILFTCTLLVTSLAAMEKFTKAPLQLTHQSPEITCIHSKEYLQQVKTRADKCQSPCEIYSHENCATQLNDIANILKATNDVIEAKKGLKKPCYSISRAENSSSWGGNTKNTHDHSFYAAIPVAVAHVLKTNLFKRILIIDENLDQNPHVAIEMSNVYPNEDAYENAQKFIQRTTQEYYEYGNGSLLYPDQKKYPDLFDLFNGKIITYDKIQNNQKLWDFLDTDGKDIDLVFYNINTYIKKHTDQRNQKIFSLFQKLIPTIFIASGRFGSDHIIDYIKTTHNNFNLFFPEKSSILHDNDRKSSDVDETSSIEDECISSNNGEESEDPIDSGETSSSDNIQHNQLTHQSPEITCIHTQKYLKHLEKQVNISTIGNSSNLTQKELQEDLNNVTDTLNAINNLIKLKQESATQPHYNIVLLSTSYDYSNASNKPKKEYYCNAYALMPIAAAYALKNSFKRILIIDEDLDQNPNDLKKSYTHIKDPLKVIQKQKQNYYARGNGSLFYPDKKDNPELFNLFNDKVITYDQIYPRTLWNFLNTDGKDINLVFYHMNTRDDYFRYQWKPNIFSLFQKLIPTIFIIPNTRYLHLQRDISNYISNIADAISNLFLSVKSLEALSPNSDSSSLQNNDLDFKPLSISISSESEEDMPTGMTAVLLEVLKNSSNELPNSETSSQSYEDSYDLDPFVFKITTDIEETVTFDGANHTLLAKRITITDDGVMEVTLHPSYVKYSHYKRYEDSKSSSSSDKETNDSGEVSSEDAQYNQLTHQSSEITCVHTQKYLQWLAQTRNPEELKAALKYVTTVLNATNDVIEAKKNAALEPHYSICVIPDNYYGAGNSEHNYADSYAIIPIAVAHALKSNLFKRVLIIDGNLNIDEDYYTQGNGSLFELFDGKIITSDKIQGNLYHFLENAGKDIDLIFYNIDMEIGSLPEIPPCWILLNKHIPVVFIFSGCPGEKNYDPVPAENMSEAIATNICYQPINIHYWYKTEK